MRPIDADNLRGRVCEIFLRAEPGSAKERRLALVLGLIDSEHTIIPPPNAPADPGGIAGGALPMSGLLLTVAVEGAAPGKAIGVKEAISMDLEKYGDVRVLRVEILEDGQMRMKEE